MVEWYDQPNPYTPSPVYSGSAADAAAANYAYNVANAPYSYESQVAAQQASGGTFDVNAAAYAEDAAKTAAAQAAQITPSIPVSVAENLAISGYNAAIMSAMHSATPDIPQNTLDKIGRAVTAIKSRMDGAGGYYYELPAQSGSTAQSQNQGQAAQIALDIAKSGWVVDPYLAAKAAKQGYAVPTAQIGSTEAARSTVPTRDLSSGISQFTALQLPTVGGTVTAYTPYGNLAQTELLGVKVGYSPTGEVGFYQQPAGHSIYNLVSGGSRAALQSGMFSITEPLTPVVYTQESAGTKLAPSANVTEAARVLAAPSTYSRLGAEVYGGYVKPLTGATVKSTGAQLSTYASPLNLANLVNPYDVNKGKAELPGANIPWSVPAGAPAIASFDTILLPVPFVSTAKGQVAKATTAKAAETSVTAGVLPSPFVSGTIQKPTGEVTVPILGATVAIPGLAFFQPSTFISGRASEVKEVPYSAMAGPDYTRQYVSSVTGKPVKEFTAGVGAPVVTERIIPETGETEITTTQKYVTFPELPQSAKAYTFAATMLPSEYEKIIDTNVRSKLPGVETGEKAMSVLDVITKATPAGSARGFADIGVGLAQAGGEAVGIPKGVLQTQKAQYETVSSLVSPTKGQYQFFYEHPETAVVSYAAGGLFGAGTRGLGAIASKSGKLSAIAPYVSKYGGAALGGLYVGGATYEETGGFRTFTPETVAATKARLTQEGIPMAVGFGRGYRLPETLGISKTPAKAAKSATKAAEIKYTRNEPMSGLGEYSKDVYDPLTQSYGAKEPIFQGTTEPAPGSYGELYPNIKATKGAITTTPTPQAKVLQTTTGRRVSPTEAFDYVYKRYGLQQDITSPVTGRSFISDYATKTQMIAPSKSLSESEALAYIKKRYPTHGEIALEYLKPRETMKVTPKPQEKFVTIGGKKYREVGGGAGKGGEVELELVREKQVEAIKERQPELIKERVIGKPAFEVSMENISLRLKEDVKLREATRLKETQQVKEKQKVKEVETQKSKERAKEQEGVNVREREIVREPERIKTRETVKIREPERVKEKQKVKEVEVLKTRVIVQPRITETRRITQRQKIIEPPPPVKAPEIPLLPSLPSATGGGGGGMRSAARRYTEKFAVGQGVGYISLAGRKPSPPQPAPSKAPSQRTSVFTAPSKPTRQPATTMRSMAPPKRPVGKTPSVRTNVPTIKKKGRKR